MNTDILLDSIIMNTDSYKCSQWPQYPPNTETIFKYIESRGGKYDKTLFFGLQMYLKEYLSKPITQQQIEEAEVFLKPHGVPFNREGWEYILKEHKGYLPLRIRAVREGTVVPTGNVLVTVENTDPKGWTPSYIEPGILRSVWYPTTVATNSWNTKQVIKTYLEQTADESALEGLDFKLIDFGARGVSSFESAGIGGAAHLVNSKVSDTITGALYVMKYYGGDMPSFSVPASEHSTMTAWGRTRESEAYKNMLDQFKGYPIISIVADSYDVYNAASEIFGGELKDQIMASGSAFICRPDSGVPSEVVLKLAKIFAEKFGFTTNSKGFKELKHVKILQGDGVNIESIIEILETLKAAGYSADNVLFGQGGALLQQVNRDDQGFAMKTSAGLIDGQWVDIYKDPITDKGKQSKKGRLTLFQNPDGSFETGLIGSREGDIMHTVFENGQVLKTWTFDEVRQQARRSQAG